MTTNNHTRCDPQYAIYDLRISFFSFLLYTLNLDDVLAGKRMT